MACARSHRDSSTEESQRFDAPCGIGYEVSKARDIGRASRWKYGKEIDDILAHGAERTHLRRSMCVPVVAFLGYGRAGKDTAGEYWCQRLGIHYVGSLSAMVAPFLARSVGDTIDNAWRLRHRHRDFWLNWCHGFRDGDLTLLLRLGLAVGDVIVGVRGRMELAAVRREALAWPLIWVGNSRCPDDPTVEFLERDCDITILNEGTHFDYYRKIDALIDMMKLAPVHNAQLRKSSVTVWSPPSEDGRPTHYPLSKGEPDE